MGKHLCDILTFLIPLFLFSVFFSVSQRNSYSSDRMAWGMVHRYTWLFQTALSEEMRSDTKSLFCIE